MTEPSMPDFIPELAVTDICGGGSDGGDDYEEDSDGVSRVTYSPPAPSARVWPRPSDRNPAGGRRVTSAGCGSILSDTSTAVGIDVVSDVSGSRSSDDEMLWTRDSSENEDVDVLALIDALDSGTSVSSKERAAAASCSLDDSIEGEGGREQQFPRVGNESSFERGRAWAEKAAFSSVSLPGAVDAACLSCASPPTQPQLSHSSHAREIIVEDLSSSSDGDTDSYVSDACQHLHMDPAACAAFDEGHHPHTQSDHEQQHPPQSRPHVRPYSSAAAATSEYSLAAAFEHSRHRSGSAVPPNLRDVTVNSAYTRASLGVSAPAVQHQRSRFGSGVLNASSSLSSSHSDVVGSRHASDVNVQTRYHLPSDEIGRAMQAMWSLQAAWDDAYDSQSSTLPPAAGRA
jgi:hypothetical protein